MTSQQVIVRVIIIPPDTDGSEREVKNLSAILIKTSIEEMVYASSGASPPLVGTGALLGSRLFLFG